ncbi:MAG: efflux RND transporter periplasmic adaptor subunit [Betaproteobacteria bacterium]|nr:efflux RND transporter periplasmic adaptor subunit [Betaproteobacteria bacterium]
MRNKVWVIGGVVCVTVLAFGWYLMEANTVRTKSQHGDLANQAVPVQVAVAKLGNLPIELDGLGTVTARKTITITPRVDSLLQHVYFHEGQAVKINQVLEALDPRPFQVVVDQWIGQLKHDQALLDDAQLDLTRYQGLLAKDSISSQQVDTQKALVHQDQGSVLSDQAQVANARLQLSFCRITAPFTGRVGLRLVDAGNMVHAASTTGLVMITQTQPIDVIFPVPEDSLEAVLNAFRHENAVPVLVYDRANTKQLAVGKLLAVDNLINVTTGTVNLKATFPNTDNQLFPNQFVNVRLQMPAQRHEVLIPASALQTGPQGPFVFMVDKANTVHMRPVVEGTVSGEMASVLQGLQTGEQVVTDGADRLREGSTVYINRKNKVIKVLGNTPHQAPSAQMASGT